MGFAKGYVFRPADERFAEKIVIDESSGCHEWIGGRDKHGYGRFSIGRDNPLLAHKYAYERVHGPVPDGLEIDHLCRNTRCVNVAHLEAVTHRENMLRAETPAMRVHRTGLCGKGHRPKVYGCPTCENERQKAKKLALRPRLDMCSICTAPIPKPGPGQRPRDKYCSMECKRKGDTLTQYARRHRLSTLDTGDISDAPTKAVN